MATWKKVLIAGADLTSTSDFTNNTGDLVSTTTASAIKVTNGANTMLGNNTQVSVELDINGLNTSLTSATATTSDLLVIADASDSNKVKKITLGNAVGAVSTGVSTVQLTADSSNTGAADNGAVVFNIAGGTGVTTAGTDGVVTINANTATTSALGVAKFNSGNFGVDAGDVTIKNGGVDTAQLAGSAVETAKINNQAVTDAKIANSGITTAGKVSLTALRFHDFGTHETTAGNLHASDRIILNDASDQLGDGDHNYTSTLGTLDGFIANNAASLGTVHSTLDINGDGSGKTLNGGGLTYVSDITVDQHGHTTAMSTSTIPNADGSTAGVLTAGEQTIGGVKTFSANTSFSGNITVAGDLIVQGSSTTLNTATLNVEDETIVGAVPAVAHATDNSAGYTAAQAAAEGGGFFLASHHGSDVAAFAGLSWSASGNLTGWSLNDTAVPDAGVAELYDSSGDANSDKYAVSVMSFGASASTEPTGNQMGVGGFHFNTADKKLYVRID